jgi:hypothetical protein
VHDDADFLMVSADKKWEDGDRLPQKRAVDGKYERFEMTQSQSSVVLTLPSTQSRFLIDYDALIHPVVS